ncbi:MAG TPA: hypothetical protein VGQ58_04550 [Candidatus Limnocylindrales bacterium]|jgi:hypothetical protein|nr:hypothetical protein [Candidatus Limnocylindrales bacterium]
MGANRWVRSEVTQQWHLVDYDLTRVQAESGQIAEGESRAMCGRLLPAGATRSDGPAHDEKPCDTCRRLRDLSIQPEEVATS